MKKAVYRSSFSLRSWLFGRIFKDEKEFANWILDNCEVMIYVAGDGEYARVYINGKLTCDYQNRKNQIPWEEFDERFRKGDKHFHKTNKGGPH